MNAALVALILTAAPLESRVFIAAGAKTEPAAKKLLAELKLPPALLLAQGYPKLVRSDDIEGLNPGFVLVVLGACPEVSAAESSYANGLAVLIQRAVKGAYAKSVAKQDAKSCPLWLVSSDDAVVSAVKNKRDDPKALFLAASALDKQGDLIGASILLRRALALGATDEDTVGLARKVEFVLEDLPSRLPP